MKKFVKNQIELNEAIKDGFELILSIENDSRGKFVVCNKEYYKEVFKKITKREFNNKCDIVFPITETLGAKTLFDN